MASSSDAIVKSCSPAFALSIECDKDKFDAVFTALKNETDGQIAHELVGENTFVVYARDQLHQKQLALVARQVGQNSIKKISDLCFALHETGKISTKLADVPQNTATLSRSYTPGVARVCLAIKDDPNRAFRFTSRRNTVAVVSDGTAVLGLGDIGPAAAMPVMEGKAYLFKAFGNVDAVPICLNTKDSQQIIDIITALAPSVGGINLEDIAAPRCFEIEDNLRQRLDIPVFHDDQHGTAIVVVAALKNALKVVTKPIDKIRVVVAGVGAAGTACTKLLLLSGVKNIIGCDRAGIIYKGRQENMNSAKNSYAEYTNPQQLKGNLSDALAGADVFIGLSGPDTVAVRDIQQMAAQPIVFAMSNPDPEIRPELALPHVSIMATGRSDFPNQINNVLAFPGIFRGALDANATTITENMKLAAAEAISKLVPEPTPERIIPSVFDPGVAENVAKAVFEQAHIDQVIRPAAQLVPDIDEF